MSIYNISSLQQKIWLLQQYSSKTLFSKGVLEIRGVLNIEKLEKCINNIINYNDILSTNYILKPGILFPYQQINKYVKTKIISIDLSHIESYGGKLLEIENFLAEHNNSKQIKYDDGCMVQPILFKFSEHLSFLHIIIPSISADSYTIIKFLKDIILNYIEENQHQEEIIQYSQFSGWHDSLQEDPEKEAVDFWNVNNYENSYNHLFEDYENLNQQSKFTTDIENQLNSLIKKVANELKCNPFSVLLSGLFTLNYLSSKTKGLIGLTLSERIHEELKNTYGMVSKTIPFGINNFEDFNFKKLIFYIENYIDEASSLQDYFSPIDFSPKLNNEICGYSVVAEYLNIGSGVEQKNNIDFEIKDICSSNEIFKLKLGFIESDKGLKLNYTFNETDFKLDEIQKYHNNYIDLLVYALDNLSESLPNLSGFENRQIENIDLDIDNYKTIATLFQQQVNLNPDNIAVVCNNESLTYDELNSKANRVANKLRVSGVVPNEVVGILGDRSLNMVVCILGIIKAGGAFLPIDISYPEDRIKYMLADSNVKTVLITNSELPGIYNKYNENPIYADKLLEEESNKNYDVEDINNIHDLVYVIYTSGSTGNPKGVMIEHKNLHSLVNSLDNIIYQKNNKELNVGLIASFSFDGSIKQIFSSLLLGHCLHIISDDIKRNGKSLVEYFIENKIDITDITPMYLDVLLSDDISLPNIGVKYFLCGGQQLYTKTVNLLHKKYPETIIVNLYGPTECCVDATYYIIDSKTKLKSANVPIGYPLQNTNIFILNDQQKSVPTGIIGEIYIGGHGVGRGYINQLELTDEKFVKLPVSNNKLYKTGDLGKLNYDGTIEFLGRNDNQIKIRGYRVELDEIRKIILNSNEIADCFVTVDKKDKLNGHIIAYLILKNDIDLVNFRHSLEKYLPEYMIPNYLVKTKKFNININGKIDINSLPDIEQNLIKNQNKHEDPRNNLELELVEIIKELRGLDKISIHDSFYDLGMDSIKVLQLLAQIGKKGYHFPVNELFSNPSIAKLSSIQSLNNEATIQTTIVGEARLSPIQKQYFSKEDVDLNHFNQSIVLKVSMRLNEEDLKKIFLKIIEHHDQLRAVFKFNEDKEVEQYIINPSSNFDIELIDYSHELSHNNEIVYNDKMLSMQQSINLEEGLLIKIGLFKFKECHKLFISMHHLICDAYSWRIFLEDLETLYLQLLQNEVLDLPLKTDSYKDWTDKLYYYANSNEFASKSQYWKNITKEKAAIIPKDQIENTCFNYDSELLRKEIFLSKLEVDTELKNVLLPALGLAVKNIFGLDKIGLHIYGLGRDEPFTNLNLSRSIGWFTSMYPFIIDTSGSDEMREVIKKVRTDISNVPDKGVGYGMLKYLTEKHHKSDFTDEFQPNMLLNYIGRFNSSEGDFEYLIEDINKHNISKNKEQRFEIIITAGITNNKLGISIEFNKKQYSEDLIIELMNLLEINIGLILTEEYEMIAQA